MKKKEPNTWLQQSTSINPQGHLIGTYYRRELYITGVKYNVRHELIWALKQNVHSSPSPHDDGPF